MFEHCSECSEPDRGQSNLAAAETTDTEDLEAMSQALPYWDNAPQPQSQLRSHLYTEEEAQELIEKAYQEGWQQGMEEGYGRLVVVSNGHHQPSQSHNSS
jgi:flagellar biosynthesis/type III secretory pathway protein FliH